MMRLMSFELMSLIYLFCRITGRIGNGRRPCADPIYPIERFLFNRKEGSLCGLRLASSPIHSRKKREEEEKSLVEYNRALGP